MVNIFNAYVIEMKKIEELGIVREAFSEIVLEPPRIIMAIKRTFLNG